MRKSIFSAAAICAVCGFAFAQKDAAELVRLRQQLSVPASTPIAFAGQAALPVERPLTIFVSTAGDDSAWQEVMQSVRKFNEKPEKYGVIEVVTDVAKANLILVHYELTDQRHDEVNHYMTMDPGLSSKISNGGKTDHWTSSKVRGYAIVRRPEGLQVLTRYERKIILGEPRKELIDALLNLLKRQSDSHKK